MSETPEVCGDCGSADCSFAPFSVLKSRLAAVREELGSLVVEHSRRKPHACFEYNPLCLAARVLAILDGKA